jgi:hypothetical protein
MIDQHDFIGGGGKVGIGYAGRPGEGPQGETCGSCAHCGVMRHHGKRYYKCTIGRVSHSDKTDIRLKSPACQHWSEE